MAENIPLIKGTLDLLILRALKERSTHGYGLSLWVERGSQGAIRVDDSAIYQALRRLEGRRLVRAEWGLTENNRKARYYELTGHGENHLKKEVETWLRYTTCVTALLQGADPTMGIRQGAIDLTPVTDPVSS